MPSSGMSEGQGLGVRMVLPRGHDDGGVGEARAYGGVTLIRRNLVLADDRTGSWWQQLTGEAIATPC